jgi:hypothetical protein
VEERETASFKNSGSASESQSSSVCALPVQELREGGREGGKERGREGWKEGGRRGGREGRKEGRRGRKGLRGR